nr:unnamed protein product [Callosobruchus analis]
MNSSQSCNVHSCANKKVPCSGVRPVFRNTVFVLDCYEDYGGFLITIKQPIKKLEKIKLKEINPYLTCHLCKGYLIDATTISECLHSFCRSCIIKFLQENSHCPVCEVIINKAKPNLK